MLETHAFVGDPIEGRGLDILVSITTQCLLGMVIRKYQENIGLFCLGSCESYQSNEWIESI